MAVVQYGGLVTELKGKVGGSVFQAGNGSLILRNKNGRHGPVTRYNAASGRAVTIVSQKWRTLTDAERLSWAAAVDNWQFTDRYGNGYFGSPYQFFMAFNRARFLVNMATVTTPPAVANATSPGALSLTLDAGLVFVNWQIPPTGTTTYVIYCTRLISPSGKLFAKRMAHVSAYSGSAGDTNVFTAWTDRFGPLISGWAIDCMVVARNRTWPYPAYTAVARGVMP